MCGITGIFNLNGANDRCEHRWPDAEGIATRPGTHAVHTLGYYRDRFGLKPQDFLSARACHDNTMAIPLHNRMTAEDFARVVACLNDLARA